MVTPLFERRFLRQLEQLCRERGVTMIHAIPHGGLEFHHALEVAAKLGLPFYLQVHDDFAYSSRGYVSPERAHAAMLSAWTGAEARFVICDRLGQEYCGRYGTQEYVVVTDGLQSVAPGPATRAPDKLRIYFMGLFHLGYEENLLVLCAALERLRRLRPSMRVSITLRCGGLRREVTKTAGEMIRILDFGAESDVERDFGHADLLYFPLQFGAKFEQRVRFSLSTKLVSYLGSGVPILCHGPQTSVACELLAQHSAALFHTSLDVESLAQKLCQICDEPLSTVEISSNALKLARSCFMLKDQRAKFWNAIRGKTTGTAIGSISPEHMPLP